MTAIPIRNLSIVVNASIPYPLGTIVNPTIEIREGLFNPMSLAITNVSGNILWDGRSATINDFSIIPTTQGVNIEGRACMRILFEICQSISQSYGYETIYSLIDTMVTNPRYTAAASIILGGVIDNVTLQSPLILIYNLLSRPSVQMFLTQYLNVSAERISNALRAYSMGAAQFVTAVRNLRGVGNTAVLVSMPRAGRGSSGDHIIPYGNLGFAHYALYKFRG